MKKLVLGLLVCQSAWALPSLDQLNPFTDSPAPSVKIKHSNVKDMTSEELEAKCREIGARIRANFAKMDAHPDPHADMWDKDWIKKP